MLHDLLPLKMKEDKYSIGAETCVTYTHHRGDDKIGCFFLLLVVGFLRGGVSKGRG